MCVSMCVCVCVCACVFVRASARVCVCVGGEGGGGTESTGTLCIKQKVEYTEYYQRIYPNEHLACAPDGRL